MSNQRVERLWRWTLAAGLLGVAGLVIRAVYEGVPLHDLRLLVGIAFVVVAGAKLALEGSPSE